MAQAAALIPGLTYEFRSGNRHGERVVIVNNATFPDSHPLRRKVTVTNEQGDTEYVLPRLLSDHPIILAEAVTEVEEAPVAVGPAAPAGAGVAAPAYEATVPTITAEAVPTFAGITDPMDPRLDIYRPNVRKVKKYLNRIMPNGMTDVDFLLQFTNDDYRSDNEGRPASVMLKGDTQGGKTFLVEALAVAWAEKMGWPKPAPIFTLSGSSGVTDYDLFGQPTTYTDPATGQDGLVWLPGIVDIAANVGGLLYLDEINAMGERVTSSLHPLVDHRHSFVNRNKPTPSGDGTFMPTIVSASLDLWIVGTYNPGYRGMGDMNEAFSARFRHLEWNYDEKVEKRLVKSPVIHLLALGCRQARDANKLRTPVGTVALQRLQRDLATFGVDAALELFVGQFKPSEYDAVRAIITDRSVSVLLKDELGESITPAEEEVQPF